MELQRTYNAVITEDVEVAMRSFAPPVGDGANDLVS